MVMNNMFSMFDPSSSFMSLSWTILIPTAMIMKSKTTKKGEKMAYFIKYCLTFIYSEINQMISKIPKNSSFMFLVLFLMLMNLNTMAIFPYNFTTTAQISISFSLSGSMWVTTMIFGWKNQFYKMITHLTPLGTPNALMNFMVIIEVISLSIRPITLSVRLSANMVAGHLLMSLLSNFSMVSKKNMIASFVPMVLLITLEVSVALVQSYVFMTLMLLYQNETTQ